MPGRNEIEIKISAKDTASKILDRVADDAEALEKLNPEIIIKASDQASDDLDKVFDRARKLDDDTVEVILRAEASRAEAEIRSLQTHLGQLDGEVAEATLAAKDQASARLDRIQSQLRDIDGRKAEVTVEADTKGFDKLGDVADALPGRLGEAAGALRGMAGGAGGVAAGLGAAAIGAFELANNFADSAIEAQKLSTLTGASVEQTSQLAQVWESTGADVNDLADVMLQVNGVLSQSPELAAQLGIEGRNVQERFVAAVEAVRDIEDPLKRAQVGSQLFGEEGVRQVGGLIAMYGDLQTAIDAVQPLSAEDARDATQFKLAMADVQKQVQKLAMTVGRELLPQVEASVEAFSGFMELTGPVIGFFSKFQAAIAPLPQAMALLKGDTAGFMDQIAKFPGVGGMAADKLEDLKDQARDAGFVVDDNIDSFGGLEAATKAQAEAADAAGMSVENYNKILGETNDEIDPVVQHMEEATDQMIAFAEGAKQLSDVQGDLNPRVDAFATSLDSVADAAGDALATYQAANEGIAGLKDSLDANNRSLDANIDTAVALRDTLQAGLVQALKDSGGNFDAVRDKAEDYRGELRKQLQQLGLNEDEVNAYIDVLGLTPEQVETAIQVSGVEEAKAKIGLLQTAISQLPRNVQTTVTQQIIAGDYVGALATINSYYARHPAILPVNLDFRMGPLPAGMSRVIQPFAAGFHGEITRPTLAMIGEKGPERVDITPRGQIPPAGVHGGGRSGGTVNVSMYLARGTRTEDALKAVERWARRNGTKALRR